MQGSLYRHQIKSDMCEKGTASGNSNYCSLRVRIGTAMYRQGVYEEEIYLSGVSISSLRVVRCGGVRELLGTWTVPRLREGEPWY